MANNNWSTEEIKKIEVELKELITDYDGVKYSVIPLAAIYAKTLRQSQEYHNVPMSDILKKALRAVIEEKVTWDSIKKILDNSNKEIAAEAIKEKKAEVASGKWTVLASSSV